METNDFIKQLEDFMQRTNVSMKVELVGAKTFSIKVYETTIDRNGKKYVFKYYAGMHVKMNYQAILSTLVYSYTLPDGFDEFCSFLKAESDSSMYYVYKRAQKDRRMMWRIWSKKELNELVEIFGFNN